MKPDFLSLESCGVVVEKQTPLSQWTTFQLGGLCPYLLCCATPQQLEKTVAFLIQENIKFIVIGSGSNLVVSDLGVDCAVVRYFCDRPLISHVDEDIIVSGSTPLDQLACYALEHGLGGINFISGIPGTVGGAIAGNAGAFGKQVGDVLKSVTLLSASGKKFEANPSQLGFSYRNSRLKETDDIVVSAVFALHKADFQDLLKEREEILRLRLEKHPDLKVYPCAGSFFRNIEPTSSAQRRQATGWFLEQAGGKQLSVGGAKIFPKHANIIVKAQGCSAQDVYELSQKMAELVKKTYNIDIVREVRFVGKFKGACLNQENVLW